MAKGEETGHFSFFWLLFREQTHTRRMGAWSGRVRAAVLAVACCGSEAAFLAVSSAPKIINTFRPSPTTSPMLPASRCVTRAVRIGLPHMVEVPGDKVELELEISVFIDPGQESVQWMRRPERVQSAGVSVLPSRSPE